jgi:protein transport protein SEC13
VTWAHPKYESVIATCGYDRQIKIWKEVNYNQWKCIYKVETQASVNTIQFAPWEYGLYLAAGVADGKVHIISHIQGNWQETQF